MPRSDFRVGVVPLALLLFASSLLDVIVDFARYGQDPVVFSWLGVSGETYAAGAVILVSVLLSALYRRRSLVLVLPTILFASYPPVQLLYLCLALLAWRVPPQPWIDILPLAWTALIFIRAVFIGLVTPQPLRWLRAALGAVLLLLPLWYGALFAPDVPWWRVQGTADAGVDPRFPNPASEPVLEAQKALLDDALGSLDDARPGTTDLYAIGFAATESDALRDDVQRALKVLDDRWGTSGRSLPLINHRAQLLATPMATVSNLRTALDEIKVAMDVDEDVVLLYVAGNGAPNGAVEVTLPPLELLPLTPQIVRRMLDDVGIRWRIVIVASCNSAAWREQLANESTLVITATGSDATGDGCAIDSEGTAFGAAMFGQGMVEAETFAQAFGIARQRLAARGASIPSEREGPQIAIGSAVEGKLRELESWRAARRASQSI